HGSGERRTGCRRSRRLEMSDSSAPGSALSTETELARFSLLIGGAEVESESGRTYDSTDPYTGTAWARVSDGSAADIDRAVEAARASLDGPWGRPTATARGKLLWKLGDLIAREADNLAELEVRDGGKLLREMSGQMRSLPDYYYYFAGMADKLE